jgi:hypothetical protein
MAALLLALTSQAPAIEFDVPQGPAHTMLTEWSRQARIQALFDDAQMADLVTSPVKGDYTTERALRILLAGTPIQYDYVNSHTIAFVIIIYCRPELGAAAPLPPCVQRPLQPP